MSRTDLPGVGHQRLSDSDGLAWAMVDQLDKFETDVFGLGVNEYRAAICAGVARQETPLVALEDVPLDGSWEVMHQDESGVHNWLRYTPKHHLASVSAVSSVLVVARPIGGS